MAGRPGKKGTCDLCSKGNRFTEKEICIVCSAKYCCHCVLRAMGSMPQGRKCVSCIGQRIDEAKRKDLGKCSRMLKRLLCEIEVKQIMKSERLCQANQLNPELVYVNCQALSQQELFLLQTCPNPPRELTHGRYWYDTFSGFWGKEGKKPCQIISPSLAVGGHLQTNASNGNTNVLVNNREITKVELLMLLLAGVKCEGETHLWVNADGSYQEEGSSAIKENIWIKTRVAKLVRAILSLPSAPLERVTGKNVGMELEHGLYSPLLVGSGFSGIEPDQPVHKHENCGLGNISFSLKHFALFPSFLILFSYYCSFGF